MMFGKSTMVDYDRLKRAVKSAVGKDSSYKPIPKGSTAELTISSGSPQGLESQVIVQPDEGYVFEITYINLTVPSGVEANVIVETDEGEYTLLSENTTSSVFIDAADFGGLTGIKKLTLYVKVVVAPTSDITVSMEYGGRQVRT